MVYNFCAGPAVLPSEVLEKAQSALVDWAGTGASVLSVSHRSPEFLAMADQMKIDLRELLALPGDYEVLFLHGGATWQAPMIAANFAAPDQRANYVDTGLWSHKAINEARKLTKVDVIASGVEAAVDTNWKIDPNAAYCQFTPNETVDGIEFYDFPQNSPIPLIADMSSTLLSRPFDISQLDMVYAGAQKNIGPAGMTLAIVKRSLLERCPDGLPNMMSYQEQVKAGSIYNTPTTFTWYIAAEVFKWIKAEGGVTAMAERNLAKSQMLYDFIDSSDFYHNDVPTKVRSWMNVPIMLSDPSREEAFLAGAKKAGLIGLKGHRSKGGLRVSLYNAMPLAGVEALIAFMQTF